MPKKTTDRQINIRVTKEQFYQVFDGDQAIGPVHHHEMAAKNFIEDLKRKEAEDQQKSEEDKSQD